MAILFWPINVFVWFINLLPNTAYLTWRFFEYMLPKILLFIVTWSPYIVVPIIYITALTTWIIIDPNVQSALGLNNATTPEGGAAAAQ